MNALQVLQTTLIGQRGFSPVVKKKTPLVLIAGESKADRLIVKDLLDLYNAPVLEAESGEETVDFTIFHRPDLIFIDSALPGLDAFEAARLIRSIDSLNIVPIVFLSDYPERTERYKAFASGADDYLIKPLDLDRIDNILGKFLFLDIK
jgi:CheY-like chemotaxis protein